MEDSSEGKKTKKRPLKELLTAGLFQSAQHTYGVQYSTAQYSTTCPKLLRSSILSNNGVAFLRESGHFIMILRYLYTTVNSAVESLMTYLLYQLYLRTVLMITAYRFL